MNIFETASNIPEYATNYYYSLLPAIKLVCSIDFGIGDQPDFSNSIHFRLINISTNNGERCGLVETASYVVNEHASERPDLSIQTNEAKALWKRMGFGFICTESLKEALFLIKQCGIPTVIFIDEKHLELRINELTNQVYTETFYHVPEISANFCTSNMCSNTHFRSWRLAKLIEKYQALFFEHAHLRAIQDCFSAIGQLQLPSESVKFTDII